MESMKNTKKEIEFMAIDNSAKNARRRNMQNKRARQIARQKKMMRKRFITASIFMVMSLALAVTITILFCQKKYDVAPTPAVSTTININDGLTIVEVSQEEIQASLRERANAGLLIEEVDCIPTEETINEDVVNIVVENASVAENVEEQAIETISAVVFDVPLDSALQEYLLKVAEEYDIEPSLIIAIIDKESDFNPNARSRSGDSGLMQVNDCNLATLKRELGIDNIYDPYQNILGGTYILSECLEDADGDIQLALMCYNMGTKNARNCWKRGVYSSEYSRDVYYMYTEVY